MSIVPAPNAGTLLEALLADGAPAEMVLVRLILETADGAEPERIIRNALSRGGNSRDSRRRLQEVAVLLERHPGAWQSVRRAAATVDHGAAGRSVAETLSGLREGFDRAVAVSPAASVALHSLGDEERLAAATAEIAEWLVGLGVVAPDRDVLDLGCGIGRFGLALARHVGSMTGTDISAGMIDAARRRCAGIPNVSFRQTSGLDLTEFEAQSFDLVLAVDSFPYLVLAGGGIARRHIAEIARVLRPQGSAVILNYSYRSQPALDRSDLRGMAREERLHVAIDGARPFSRWDGTAFQLVKGRTRGR